MSRYRAELTSNETPGVEGAGGTWRFPVVVPHTELRLTGIALREAVRLARGLDVRVTVLAVRIVPFPEPLDPGRRLPEFDDLVALAEAAETPVTIHVVYAREWEAACEQVLERGSLVVIAVRRAWLRTREERLASRLSRAGHTVTTVAA
jgi:nucleotide-binding universal stress UspA family protein